MKKGGPMIDWQNVIDSIPFMALNTTPPKLSGTRITEAIIIAALTALATSYITVSKLETKTELRSEYYEKQFDEQRNRRDKELQMLRTEMKEKDIKSQVQYETLRQDVQRIAVAMERVSYGKIRRE